MGTWYRCQCECGYRKELYVGFGMHYESGNNEINHQMRNEAFGQEYAKILKETQYGFADTTQAIYQCTQCGDFESMETLDICQQNEELEKMHFCIYAENKTKMVREYVHRCKKCNGVMKKILHDEEVPSVDVKCPSCNQNTEIIEVGVWD